MAGMEERMTAVEGGLAALGERFDTVSQARLINGRTLGALRETQLEHGLMLERHGQILEQHGRKLDKLENDVHELKQGQQGIVHMLTILIERDAPDD